MRELEPDWAVLIRDCFEHPGGHDEMNRFFAAVLPYLRAALTARYTGESSLFEDALQSASLKFLQIFQETPARPLSLGYFIIVARNCLIDELRRRKGHLPIDEIAESDLPSVPAATLDQRDDRMLLVQQGMMQLDSRCQFILESYYIDEVDGRQLAQWLEIGPESVHMAIKRCRDRLRRALEDLTAQLSHNSTT